MTWSCVVCDYKPSLRFPAAWIALVKNGRPLHPIVGFVLPHLSILVIMDWEFSWTWVAGLTLDVKVHIELVVLILTKASICTAPWPSLLARTCLSSITCFKETTAKAGMGLSYLHWATIMQHPRSHVADVLHVYQGYWSGAFYRAMKVNVHNSSESVKQIVNENM